MFDHQMKQILSQIPIGTSPPIMITVQTIKWKTIYQKSVLYFVSQLCAVRTVPTE